MRLLLVLNVLFTAAQVLCSAWVVSAAGGPPWAAVMTAVIVATVLVQPRFRA